MYTKTEMSFRSYMSKCNYLYKTIHDRYTRKGFPARCGCIENNSSNLVYMHI